MKGIQNIEYKQYGKSRNHFMLIQHTKGTLRIIPGNVNFHAYRINISSSPSENFKEYSEYAKEKLEEFQMVLLKSYVYVNDELDKAIENSDSKINLDLIRKKILDIRGLLRHITNYIDSYDELLEEYRNT